MILCITLNPVLDWTFRIDQFQTDYRTDARELHRYVGGKGNNVARVLGDLGVAAIALNPLGGENGQALLRLMEQEKLNTHPVWVSTETRLAVTQVARNGERRATFAPSQPWTEEDAAAVWAAFETLLPQVEMVCLCGSSPAPAADALFFDMIQAANRRGLLTLLDSYGSGLKNGLRAAPTMLKMNQQEAEDFLGFEISAENSLHMALRELQAQSRSAQVIITCGQSGAVMLAADHFYQAEALKLEVVNTIGCGDAFTAGSIVGLLQGLKDRECFQLSMAAASANTLTWQPGKVDPAEVYRLIEKVNINRNNHR